MGLCLPACVLISIDVNLSFIHYSAIGVDYTELSMCIHLLCKSRTPQSEPFPSSEQDVQVVMVIVMQSRGGSYRAVYVLDEANYNPS